MGMARKDGPSQEKNSPGLRKKPSSYNGRRRAGKPGDAWSIEVLVTKKRPERQAGNAKDGGVSWSVRRPKKELETQNDSHILRRSPAATSGGRFARRRLGRLVETTISLSKEVVALFARVLSPSAKPSGGGNIQGVRGCKCCKHRQAKLSLIEHAPAVRPGRMR